MATATFLSNEVLWQTLSVRIKLARHVDAAIAYFGQNGASLFPLQRGHRLIVDMSPHTVKAGSTDPREIEKLDQRGVEIFSRRNLHAKIVIADNTLIVGSANISKESQERLDEAAILTTDPVAVRRAREFIDHLCTERVLPEYLELCKQSYRPPRFSKAKSDKTSAWPRIRHAKLWMVNLWEGSIPKSERERYKEGEKEARKLMKDSAHSELIYCHWSRKPKMANELEAGDWIIQVVTGKNKSVLVYPPAQFLFVDQYVREKKSGKLRYVFHLEIPKSSQRLSWADFCRGAKSVLSPQELDKPRTRPIRDIQIADDLFRLWTPKGRISKR